MEDIKEIKDYPGYFATTTGKIYSNKRGSLKEIKCNINKAGYYYCNFRINGKTISKQIHRIIALTFIECNDLTLSVNHKDGNKLNNNIDNLEFITQKENMKHASNNKLFNACKGERSNLSKLKEKDILEIRNKYSSGKYSSCKLAKEYNVDRQTIRSIVKRITWNHI